MFLVPLIAPVYGIPFCSVNETVMRIVDELRVPAQTIRASLRAPGRAYAGYPLERFNIVMPNGEYMYSSSLIMHTVDSTTYAVRPAAHEVLILAIGVEGNMPNDRTRNRNDEVAIRNNGTVRWARYRTADTRWEWRETTCDEARSIADIFLAGLR